MLETTAVGRKWTGSRQRMRGWGHASSDKGKKGRLSWGVGKLSGHREVLQPRGFRCLCARRHFTSFATSLVETTLTSHLDYCSCLITILPTFNLISLLPFLSAASRVMLKLSLIAWPLWTRPSKYLTEKPKSTWWPIWSACVLPPTAILTQKLTEPSASLSLAPWFRPQRPLSRPRAVLHSQPGLGPWRSLSLEGSSPRIIAQLLHSSRCRILTEAFSGHCLKVLHCSSVGIVYPNCLNHIFSLA